MYVCNVFLFRRLASYAFECPPWLGKPSWLLCQSGRRFKGEDKQVGEEHSDRARGNLGPADTKTFCFISSNSSPCIWQQNVHSAYCIFLHHAAWKRKKHCSTHSRPVVGSVTLSWTKTQKYVETLLLAQLKTKWVLQLFSNVYLTHMYLHLHQIRLSIFRCAVVKYLD